MKIKKNELIFFIGIIILALRSLIQSSSIIDISNLVSNILLFIAYTCFIFNIVVNKINLKELRSIFILDFYWFSYIYCFKIYCFS